MATIETKWDEIPEEWQFTAVDECGTKWAYLYKPELSDCVWCCVKPEDCTFIGYVDGDCENWRESLRERPSATIPVTLLDDVTAAGFKLPLTYGVTFYGENNTEVGKLEWNKDTMEFSGNATESAKTFMHQLIEQFHAAIEIEIERRVKELQSSGESDE